MQNPNELAEARLQIARLEALRQYPLADEELVGSLTDPEQITRVAQRDHARAQQFQQGQRQGNGTPLPPTNSATSIAPEEELRMQRTARLLKSNHRTALRRIGADEADTGLASAEEAQEYFYKKAWNAHMAQRKAGGMKTAAPAE